MPTGRIPKYSLHKASGQARVCIDGRDHYLGPHESPESKAEYARLIDQWRLRQRAKRLPALTVGELILLYDVHAKAYYRKNGKPTSEVGLIKLAMRQLAELYARRMLVDFGPRDLKRVREAMTRIRHGSHDHQRLCPSDRGDVPLDRQ